MKKLLFLLLSLISLTASAQINDSRTIDFTNPTGLTPSVTPMHGNAQIVMVTDKVFESGPVRISFKNGSVATGAQIVTTKRGDNPETYNLRITSTTFFTVSVVDGAVLKSIQLSEDSFVGDLSVTSEDAAKGDFTETSAYRTWVPADGAGDVTNITFINSGSSTEIKKLTVEYVAKSDILVATTDIADSKTIDSFTSMTLDFDSNITTIDSSKPVMLTSADGTVSKQLTAIISDGNVVLKSDAAIEHDDTYTVSIAANTFMDAMGYGNKQASFSFKVLVPKNTFSYNTVTPEPGRVDEITGEITLAFPKAVGRVTDKAIIINKDGEPLRQAKLSKVDGNDKLVSLKFDGVTSAITELGKYSIVIPEQSIFNAFPDDAQLVRYNPEIKLDYVISNAPPEDSETMKQAKQLLTVEGIGYPLATSAARTALKALVEAETVPSDADLRTAIAAFYADAAVTLPTTDKWYKIYNVNANGSKLYLEYADGKVSIGSNAAKAGAFKATQNADGTMSFCTNDGKYLHVLTAMDGKYIGTSSSNVTSTYDAAVNNITFARAIVNGVDNDKTFGLLSMHGSLGIDVVMSTPASAYALVSHNAASIVTSPEYSLVFTANISGAFGFAETVKPEDVVPPVDLECSISPEVADNDKTMMKLSFSSTSKVVLNNEVQGAYIKDEKGNKMGDVVLKTTATDNVFEFSIVGLENGSYSIVIPEGSFKTTVDGKVALTKAIVKSFAVGKSGAGDTEGFDYSYNILARWGDTGGIYVDDQVFVNYVLTLPYNWDKGLVPDPTKQVIITDLFSASSVKATGHFESYVIPEAPQYPAVRLVYDSYEPSIVSGSSYAVIIEKATLGDNNFGKYLEDRTSVSPSECKVNNKMVLQYHIDNYQAAAVEGVEVDSTGDEKVVDLLGRQVKTMKKGQLYIVKGKKVLYND